MSLRDQACYTLSLKQSTSDPSVVELVEVEGVKHESRYARVKERKEGEVYSAAVYDYLTGAKLSSTGYALEKGKQRRLQLHGPDEDVAFEFTGKINFEWTFTFQSNKFRWNKEIYGKDYICSIDRKPDPKVEICLADRNDPAKIQILHYNIERFPNEITDLRGLETLLVTTFMSFVDAADERATRPAPGPAQAKISPSSSSSAVPVKAIPADERVINEDDFEPEDTNEIRVGLKTNMDDHVARAIGLLMDPGVVFVIIRTKVPAAAQRALEVALGVTRFRHREGLGDLHQYVVEQTEPNPSTSSKIATPTPVKGPKVINLDDPIPQPQPPPIKKPAKPTTATALNIAIYLSTIDLPDLHPNRRRASSSNANTNTNTNANSYGNNSGLGQNGRPGSSHTIISTNPARPSIGSSSSTSAAAAVSSSKPPTGSSGSSNSNNNKLSKPVDTTSFAARPQPNLNRPSHPASPHPRPPASASNGLSAGPGAPAQYHPRPISPQPPARPSPGPTPSSSLSGPTSNSASASISSGSTAPSPPAPAPLGGFESKKGESVVKKLIAMSRR